MRLTQPHSNTHTYVRRAPKPDVFQIPVTPTGYPHCLGDQTVLESHTENLRIPEGGLLPGHTNFPPP